jgi:general secretion pathway protein D
MTCQQHPSLQAFFRPLFALLALSFGMAPALRAQPAPANPQEIELIPLILVDQDTNSIIELYEELTGKLAIRAQNVPQVQINFKTKDEEGLELDEAILVIESLLSLNGVAITKLGDNEKFFRVLPAAGVNAQVPDFLNMEEILKLPASQKVYSTYIELDFLTVEQAMPKIQPFLTPGVGTTVLFEKANSFLITDALINIQRIKTLLDDIDKPSTAVELKFFPLKHMDATEMQQRFDRLGQGPLKSLLEGNTTMESDERTNQLMVLTHRSNIPLLSEIIEKLDVNVEAKTKSKVFSIKHAEAKEVEATITQLINNQQSVRKQTSKKTGSNPVSSPTPAAAKPAVAAAVSAAASGEGGKNLQFSDYVIIVADERSNAIVCSGTENDLEYIENLVEQIDVLLAQVRIEVVIAEVTLTKDTNRGINAFGISFANSLDKNYVRRLVVDTDTNKVVFPDHWRMGLGELSVGKTWGRYGLDFVFNAAKTNDNIKILSSPAILTTHNKEAIINVSESRPITTSLQRPNYSYNDQSSTIPSQYNYNSINEQVQYRDVGIQLKVKPKIGDNGVLQMEIEQKIEGVDETSVNDKLKPIIKKKEANSFISVQDREVIIIGGLQSLKTTKNVSNPGLLSFIPIINELTSTKSNKEEMTELIIFLRPYVINNVREGSEYTSQQIDSTPLGLDIKEFLEKGAYESFKSLTEDEKKGVGRIRDFLGFQKDE